MKKNQKKKKKKQKNQCRNTNTSIVHIQGHRSESLVKSLSSCSSLPETFAHKTHIAYTIPTPKAQAFSPLPHPKTQNKNNPDQEKLFIAFFLKNPTNL